MSGMRYRMKSEVRPALQESGAYCRRPIRTGLRLSQAFWSQPFCLLGRAACGARAIRFPAAGSIPMLPANSKKQLTDKEH
jgi:hypothetical protein